MVLHVGVREWDIAAAGGRDVLHLRGVEVNTTIPLALPVSAAAGGGGEATEYGEALVTLTVPAIEWDARAVGAEPALLFQGRLVGR
jgi:hypothetical protein